MNLIVKRKGNDETNNRVAYFEISVWRELSDFTKSREEIYIFGKGNIGSSLGFFLNEADIPFDGHIDSGELDAFRNRYAAGKVGIILGLSNAYYGEVLPLLRAFADESDLFFIPEPEKQNIEVQFSIEHIKKNFWITVYTNYHCNINCKSCLTHSPLCKPEFYDFDAYVRDLAHVKKLGLNITRLNFSGGEPFLHPQILEMLEHGRTEFPDIPTTVFTNGSLLYKLSDVELNKLAKERVELAITEYPVPGVAYREHLAAFYENVNGINIDVQRISDDETKEFYKHPYNLNGDTPKHEFINCHRYRHCFMLCLYQHRFWKCYNAPNAENFNERFGASIMTSPSDSLEVRTGITAEDVYEFCRRRTPFCGNCRPLKEKFEWALSERKPEEWT